MADYIKSFTVTYGVAFALTVAFYVCFFDNMMLRIFDIGIVERLFLSFCFIFSHFQITKTELMDNDYLLNPVSLNLGINYLLPFLLCASLAFYVLGYFLNSDPLIELAVKEKVRSIKTGLLLLLLYTCVFSNLMESGVLFCVVTVCFAYKFIIDKKTSRHGNTKLAGKKKKTVNSKQYHSGNSLWNRYYSYFVVFILGAICMLFEASGGRAGDFESGSGHGVETFLNEAERNFHGLNIPFILITVVIIITAVILALSHKNEILAEKYKRFLIIVAGSFLLNLLLVSALCIKLGAGYFTRGNVFVEILLWYILAWMGSLAYILKNASGMKFLIPIAAYIMLFVLVNVKSFGGNAFIYGAKLYGDSDLDYYYEDTEIVKQFVEADKSGVSEFDLYVKGDVANYDWAGGRICTTLMRHGIISHEMDVNVVKVE